MGQPATPKELDEWRTASSRARVQRDHEALTRRGLLPTASRRGFDRNFDRLQPRDPHTGKWIETGAELANVVKSLTFGQIMDLYGGQYDERMIDRDNGLALDLFDRGEMVLLAYDGDPTDEATPARVLFDGFDADTARHMADQLDWAVEAGAARRGRRRPSGNGLVDWDYAGDNDAILVGYDPSGDVRIGFPAPGDDDRLVAWDLSSNEAADLIEALRDFADALDNEDYLPDEDVRSRPLVARSVGPARASRKVPRLVDKALYPPRRRADRPASKGRRRRSLPGTDARHQPGGHNQESHGNAVGAGGVSNPLDRMRLAGKIDLLPGEQLVGSQKFDGESGTVRVAATDRDGQRFLRLGIGGPGFGGRDVEAGPWPGGQDRTVELNVARKRIRDEQQALEAEWDRLDKDPSGDPARKAAIQARLDEIDELPMGDVSPSGYTAALDQAAAQRLHAQLTEALSAGTVRHRERTAIYDEIEKLKAQRDRMLGMDRLMTPAEEAKWDKLTAQIEALQAGRNMFGLRHGTSAASSIKNRPRLVRRS